MCSIAAVMLNNRLCLTARLALAPSAVTENEALLKLGFTDGFLWRSKASQEILTMVRVLCRNLAFFGW